MAAVVGKPQDPPPIMTPVRSLGVLVAGILEVGEEPPPSDPPNTVYFRKKA